MALRAAARLPAVILALAALVFIGSPLVGFVSGPGSQVGLRGTAPRGETSTARNAEEKSLFETTKTMNSKMSEVNGENESLMDTDGVWGIVFTVVGVLATVFFVWFLYSMKPVSSS
mmetsp:Transcript_64957/g.164626  ORF Transcript_64957/g.164626 Transcript_64957/m.164626 type:complete len:116 (+) Transcript_64957:78-425(+)